MSSYGVGRDGEEDRGRSFRDGEVGEEDREQWFRDGEVGCAERERRCMCCVLFEEIEV